MMKNWKKKHTLLGTVVCLTVLFLTILCWEGLSIQQLVVSVGKASGVTVTIHIFLICHKPYFDKMNTFSCLDYLSWRCALGLTGSGRCASLEHWGITERSFKLPWEGARAVFVSADHKGLLWHQSPSSVLTAMLAAFPWLQPLFSVIDGTQTPSNKSLQRQSHHFCTCNAVSLALWAEPSKLAWKNIIFFFQRAVGIDAAQSCCSGTGASMLGDYTKQAGVICHSSRTFLSKLICQNPYKCQLSWITTTFEYNYLAKLIKTKKINAGS